MQGYAGYVGGRRIATQSHILSLGKLRTLEFSELMHADYVDLFLLLFSDASRIESHNLLNHHIDLVFERPTDCSFALRGSEPAPHSIFLHGIHLFEQIDHAKSCTAKFQTDCGSCLSEGGIAVGVRG